MIVLDSSVIISILEETDKNHTTGVSLLKTMDGQYLFVPSLTWTEVLVGAIKSEQVDDAQNRIQRKLGVAVANPDGADWPLKLAEMRVRTGLKMPDAFVLATAEAIQEKTGGAKVATFDKRLATAAASEGLLYEPQMA